MFKKIFLGLFILVCSTLSVQAQSPQPCQWNYSITGDTATASYCANVSPGGAVVYNNSTQLPDFGAFINSILAKMPHGGIIDARAITGAQTISTPIVLPSNVSLELGNIQLTSSKSITLGNGASIVGLFCTHSIGFTNDCPTVIAEAPNANLPDLIIGSGTYAYLGYLTLDGNKANETSGDVLAVQARMKLDTLTVQNGFRHNITYGSPTLDFACCGEISNVLTINAGSDNLYCNNTADTFVQMSSFENAGAHAVELNNCPTWRFAGGNDFSGSGAVQVWIHGNPYTANTFLSSRANQFVGNQFGGSIAGDIQIDGGGNGSLPLQGNYAAFDTLVEGNYFLPSITRPSNTYDNILETDSAGNLYTGNIFDSVSGASSRYAINISFSNALSDVLQSTIGPNQYTGTYGTSPWASVSTTTKIANAQYRRLGGSGYAYAGSGATSYFSEGYATSAATPFAGQVARFETVGGYLKNFSIILSTAPGAGNNVTFTLYVNGIATSVTCTISGASSFGCSDNVDIASINASQSWYIKAVASASAAASVTTGSLEFDPNPM